MERGEEDGMVALLMVDVWSRYVSVMPFKLQNIQTAGNSLMKLPNEIGRANRVEVAGDNESVLAAGMPARFCFGLETILTWNRMRTSVAERFPDSDRTPKDFALSPRSCNANLYSTGQQCILLGFTIDTMFMQTWQTAKGKT